MRRALILLLALASSPALATDYFVRTDGNDANTGLANTSGGAWKTIGKCLSTITAGNRCRVQPGTYLETAPRSLANSGSIKGNDVATCSCTKGSTTINCTSDVSGAVAAGDWVRCDSTGSYFNWARVGSVATSTINLESSYLGDGSYLGESTGGTHFLDVARFVEVVGDGSRDAIVMTSTTTSASAGITFTPDGTWAGVYTFDVTAKPAPWNNPKSFRQDTPTWDTYYGNQNGRDSLQALTVGSCPCCATTCAETVYRVPGSWCRTGNTVYLQLYDSSNPNLATVEAGYSGVSQSWLTALNKNYVLIANIKLTVPWADNGYSASDLEDAFIVGGNDFMLRDITVEGSHCAMELSVSRTRMELRGIRCLDKLRANSSASAPMSGLRLYNVEIRGGIGNLWSTDNLRGTSTSDMVLFDRIYLHRGFSTKRSACSGCSNDAWWDCSTRDYPSSALAFSSSHGAYFGSANGASNYQVGYLVVQNSVIEITYDGWAFFNRPSVGNVIFRNNTFGFSGTTIGDYRSELAIFGTSGVVASPASLYNNIFFVDNITGSNFNGHIINFSDSGTGTSVWANTVSDYNLFLHPWNAPTNIGTIPEWVGFQDREDATMAQAIQTYSQESHSLMVCYSGCSGAAGNYYNDGATARAYFIADRPSVGNPSNYTPTLANRGRNSGLLAQCPPEDFYGNPRSDGACDIGAVEYQSSPPPGPPVKLRIRPGTKIR